ncbi:MAG TPA: hypothetical protein VGA21_05155 [Cyclobacteriaceae bacterium]|jgi:hypothetical protein
MILEILQTGASAFIILVSVLLAFVAGLSTIDYLKTKENDEQES